jgi:hypothetical protein
MGVEYVKLNQGGLARNLSDLFPLLTTDEIALLVQETVDNNGLNLPNVYNAGTVVAVTTPDAATPDLAPIPTDNSRG